MSRSLLATLATAPLLGSTMALTALPAHADEITCRGSIGAAPTGTGNTVSGNKEDQCRRL